MININFLKHFFAKINSVHFFGSGPVGKPSVQQLFKIYPNLKVITQATIENRKTKNQVQLFCKQNGISCSSPIKNRTQRQIRKQQWNSFLSQLDNAQLGIVCSYGYMIPSKIIQKFSKGMIVVHPSLLPKYRGGAPIFHAIANGQNTSGISFIQISKKSFDKGNILYQVQCQIGTKDLYKQIQNKLANKAAQILPFVIQNLQNLRPGKVQNQIENDVDKHLLQAPIIYSKKLDLNREAKTVYNWSRALTPPHIIIKPIQKQIVIRLKDQYLQGNGQVGDFLIQKKKLFIRCADKYVRITSWNYFTYKQMHPSIFVADLIRSGKYDKVYGC